MRPAASLRLPTHASRGRGRAHRVFHPLCGATPPVLLRMLAGGGIAPSRAHVVAIAAAMAVLRAPFTVAEAAFAAAAVPRSGRYPAPIFIVGHWRSGTTHLSNLLSRSAAFGHLSPMAVGLPAEALGLGRIAAPFIGQFFPRHRLIDDIALTPDLPQEDELAMANLSTLSSQHGIYAPKRLHIEFDRALFGIGARPGEQVRWARRLERFVAKMTWAAGRPLLIRNPANSTRIATLLSIWPDARFIHIHRDPPAVYASSVRMWATLLRELALSPATTADARALVRDVYPRLIASLLDATDSLPSRQHVAVSHAALEREPSAILEEIHDALSLPGYERAAPAMADWVARHRRVPRPFVLDDADLAFLRTARPVFARLGYDAGRDRPTSDPRPATFAGHDPAMT